MKRAVALAATLAALAASAGPFGYEMGQKIEGGKRDTILDGMYTKFTRNVPAPFTSAYLDYMPNAGLCSLGASIYIGTTADRLDKAKRKANEAAAERWRRGIVAALRDKYGEPNEINDYTAWEETPRLGADNLRSVHVFRRPTRVYYQFTNYDDCEAEAKAEAEADAEALRGLLF